MTRPALSPARAAERSEYARRSDLARGFAGMATDDASRAHFERVARQWGDMAAAIDGPIPADIAAMPADDLARELGIAPGG